MIDARSARRGLFLVFLILFLDIMGIAIIMPVLPTYLRELTGDTISEAAVDGGWLLLVYSGMQFRLCAADRQPSPIASDGDRSYWPRFSPLRSTT